MNVNRPFWLLVLSIVFGLTLPILIQDAMFQDGMLYSCVAHNMGTGFGSFWFPQYSTLNLEGIPSFHEQPPLVFGLQALLYWCFGDSMYIERFYTFAMIVLNILLTNRLWKDIFVDQPAFRPLGWLPVLFWIMIPVCYWSYQQNMIENTVSVFTLSAVILSLRAVKKEKNSLILWILSSFFIFLASFSKGVPGFFPITFPFLYWLITKRISFADCVKNSLILVSVPVILYTIFILNPISRESLSIYFFERLIGRVNSMPTVSYRLDTAWRLFTESIPVILILLIVARIASSKQIPMQFARNSRDFWLYFCLALSGTFPLMLTMVQKGWYMVPAFPFLSIAFAIIISPVVAVWLERIPTSSIGFKRLKLTSYAAILTILVLTMLQKGKISRHPDIVRDVYKIGQVVPKFSTLTVPPIMYDQYEFILQGFLVRYFNISISPEKQYDYYLKEQNMDVKVPVGYKQVNIDLEKYELYKFEN
jgi:hypothetical protein